MKTIGILAGMGPRSTSPFLELVLDECQKQYGAKYDIDYPHILIYSLPTPFYIDREIDEKMLKNSIEEGLKKLAGSGVDFIAMPCNSAHKYFDSLSHSIGIPLLNIIDETIENIKDSNYITVFATETTISSGIYQKGIVNKGYKFVLEDSWQLQINEIIQMIKAKDNYQLVQNEWNKLLNVVKSKGVDTIISACTDLNVIIEDIEDIRIIDSSACLAQAAIREYLKE